MRLFSAVLFFASLLIVSTGMAAELLGRPTAPMPGSATPQPYAQPQVRPLGPSITSPPLLNTPSRRQPLSVPQPLPRDKPLQQLQPQRERNSPHPAEELDGLERAK